MNVIRETVKSDAEVLKSWNTRSRDGQRGVRQGVCS
jgi:hypothetical protein